MHVLPGRHRHLPWRKFSIQLVTYRKFLTLDKKLFSMNFRWTGVALLFGLSNTLFGQGSQCNCLENLATTIQKTEENYAGFPAKVNAKTEHAYRQLVAQVKQKAQTETNAKRCYYIISEYVRFFKDKHFILSYYNPRDFDSIVVPFSEEKLRMQWARVKPSPVEGIWTNPDSTIRIAIQKKKDGSFKAVRIESKVDSYPPGFEYFTLTPGGAQFIVREYDAFVSTATPAKQNGNLLQLWNHAMWGKIFPQSMIDQEAKELATWKGNNKGLAFKRLTDDVAYLKIPSFFNNDNSIQQLVAENDAIIRNSKYLIVDLTGNGGGNTGWIYFLPYLMTNPVVQQPSFLRVTPDNVKMKLPDLEPFVNNPIPDDYKKYFSDEILSQYKKAYAELPETKEKFYPVPGVTFPLDSITRYPEKIALVVDNFCGSSTEYFFYLSKQSRKTISYGTNTIGMMDYEGLSTPTPLSYDKFILTIPIVKSSWTDRKPIDQTGFKPDVTLNIPQNQWIGYIVTDLQMR
jgi:hypothetical protein